MEVKALSRRRTPLSRRTQLQVQHWRNLQLDNCCNFLISLNMASLYGLKSFTHAIHACVRARAQVLMLSITVHKPTSRTSLHVGIAVKSSSFHACARRL
jgi:hypothetical protein